MATVLTVAVSAAAGAVGVLVFFPGAAPETTAPAYICPMHAEIVSPQPSTCSICGMDLVPVERETEEEDPPVVTIPARMIHSLGVRTIRVEHRQLQRRIETVGYVEYDRTRLRHIYPPADGQIEELALSSEGERVSKGQFLFQLFSPMLGSSADKTYSGQDGVVVALNIIEGAYVRSTTRVITLGDLARVWVLADVFEAQAGWVEPGMQAEVRLPYVAGRSWKGKVDYVYPNLDTQTRTLKVRLSFDNPGELLKPNMHADVTIDCGPAASGLAVPRDAVIETERERRVILALGRGRFRPQPVTTGTESGDWVEITAGVEEGDEVVVSSQFLIDSEANLEASLSRMTGPGEKDDRN